MNADTDRRTNAVFVARSRSQALVDIATIGLIQVNIGRRQDDLLDQLEAALDLRIAIEQAKGMVAQVVGITPTEAFGVLRSYAAEHNHRRRHAVEAQRVLAGDDALAVDLETGQRPRVGARREDHRFGRLVAGAVDLDRVGRDEASAALDHGDAALLDQTGQAFVQPGDDAILVGVDLFDVDALERGAHPDLLALPGGVGGAHRDQQRAQPLAAGAKRLGAGPGDGARIGRHHLLQPLLDPLGEGLVRRGDQAHPGTVPTCSATTPIISRR